MVCPGAGPDGDRPGGGPCLVPVEPGFPGSGLAPEIHAHPGPGTGAFGPSRDSFLILHPGSHQGAGEKIGLRRIAQGIDQALARAEVPDIQILLETTAGAGTQLGCRLEQLRDIIGLSRNEDRLGVCLDTSHVYAAGYDLSWAEAYEDFFGSFDRLISLKRLKAVHANDSKTPLGARVDRHEQIGLGHLGIDTFERLLGDPRYRGGLLF